MRRLKRAHQRHTREQANQHKKFRRRAVAVGTAAAITLGAGAGLNKALAAHTPDDHQRPITQDADADLLANIEEVAIGYRLFNGDQNRNEIPDGVELAKRCAAIINQLPPEDEALPGETYKIEHYTYGEEICHICPTVLNMGGMEIVNPKLGLSYPVGLLGTDNYLPFISLHYMEHGSFSFSGTTNSGRVDLPQLLRVLELRFPYDPNDHQLPVDANDLDGDLLTDSEELEAGFDLYNPDQDQDLTPDGIELAKQCAAIIEKLPWAWEVTDPNETYKWCAPQNGVETCEICAATVNMGPAGIVNPELGLSIDCPLIAIHYMEHGSFNYAGDIHKKGRIDVPLLVKIFEMPRQCGDLGTIYLPADLNEDCKVNFADFKQFADKWLQSTDPNDDSGIEY